MGSVLQRFSRQGSDGALSSSHSTNSTSLSSPSILEENQSTSRAENTAGYVQQGYHSIRTAIAVENSALSLPHTTKPDGKGLSFGPEQRDRMDYHKSIALARRKEKLMHQNQDGELPLNQLTSLQSTPFSQHCSPLQNTISSQQAETHLWSTRPLRQAYYGGTTLVSSYTSPSAQQDIYQGPALTLSDRHARPLQQSIDGVAHTRSGQNVYGVPTLPSMHSARYLQHGSPDLHQNMSGSPILSATHNAQSPQKGKHTTFSSVQNSAPLQRNSQGGLAPIFVHYPSSSLQGNHSGSALDSVSGPLKLQQQIGHNRLAGNSSYGSLTLQHDGCVGSSFTLEQRARMACEREKALAKLKRRQKQEHSLNKIGTSQCTIADGSTNAPSQKSYQMKTHNFDTETCFQHSQDSYREFASNYVQKSRHSALPRTFIQSVASSQEVTCSGSSLTPEQRAYMAFQKEMAIARRNARLWQQQQQDEHLTRLTNAQCMACSQQDAHPGSSLTQEQRTRMAHQKEMAIARRNARLQQQQQQQDEYKNTQLPCAQSIALSQQDTYSGSFLSHELRTCMAHQKEMALARCNVRLRQQQEDEQHHMHHKPPSSKQETDSASLKFATNLFTNCAVDCSQSASNQEMGASQEGAISQSLHQPIFALHDGHGSSSFPSLQSYSTLQQNEDGGFSFTPVESSLSSQEDSYDASFLALAQNGHLASSKEAFSSCSQNCGSMLSMDHAAKCSQSSALYQLGAPMVSQQVVSLDEGNMDRISLTPQQKAHMASQKERALAKRKMVLEQEQLQRYVNKPSGIEVGCSQAPSPCSPVPRAGSWEYFSAEHCDGLTSDCCRIASQESKHMQKKR